MSHSARLDLNFELAFNKSALLSDHSGYASYPVRLCAQQLGEQKQLDVFITLTYSSTCPCSAALSRQLYADAIPRQFNQEPIDSRQLLDWLVSEQGSVATPHSQRSFAYLQLRYGHFSMPELPQLIEQFEMALATPVQTAVKRVDEQAFARLNATNLMFCEDAARKLKAVLINTPEIIGYRLKVEHQESLHAHNAVAMHSTLAEPELA